MLEIGKFPENAIKPAHLQLLDEYQATGKAFHVEAKRYFSTAAFEMKVVGGVISSTPERVFLRAEPQQRHLFTYAIGDDVKGVQLGNRAATEGDTNIGERRETNDEDFAIMGLSAHRVGLRVQLERLKDDGDHIGDWTDPEHEALAVETFDQALVHIVDPGSHVVAPELGSPLTLEEVAFQELTKRCTVSTAWNLKTDELIGLLRDLPEGGAASYLRSSGEPTAHNVLRLSKGYKWRREGSHRDSKFSLQVALQRPFVMIATNPDTLPRVEGADEDPSLAIRRVWVDFAVVMHGLSFYYPSENA